ncbi:MAG: hypothetical protein DYH08_07220 [Actinobacteria bacterium ATB1]|nr:hypothetical protein [Actinobacteria bacterium ATB1]
MDEVDARVAGPYPLDHVEARPACPARTELGRAEDHDERLPDGHSRRDADLVERRIGIVVGGDQRKVPPDLGSGPRWGVRHRVSHCDPARFRLHVELHADCLVPGSHLDPPDAGVVEGDLVHLVQPTRVGNRPEERGVLLPDWSLRLFTVVAVTVCDVIEGHLDVQIRVRDRLTLVVEEPEEEAGGFALGEVARDDLGHDLALTHHERGVPVVRRRVGGAPRTVGAAAREGDEGEGDREGSCSVEVRHRVERPEWVAREGNRSLRYPCCGPNPQRRTKGALGGIDTAGGPWLRRPPHPARSACEEHCAATSSSRSLASSSSC